MPNPENLIGKGFKKGQSGNPKGRPPGIPNTKTRLKRLLEFEQEILNPVNGKKEKFTIAEQMDLAMINKARKGDVKAYNALIDRLEGKPQSYTDLTSGGKPLPTVIIGEEYANKPRFRIDNTAEINDMATESSDESGTI